MKIVKQDGIACRFFCLPCPDLDYDNLHHGSPPGGVFVATGPGSAFSLLVSNGVYMCGSELCRTSIPCDLFELKSAVLGTIALALATSETS